MLQRFLKILALVLVMSMTLKALIDIDLSWDTWSYHLPFAARLWGIVAEDSYILSTVHEHVYDGFPLLVEFLQGFFWFSFGRPEFANLVSLLALMLYACFLRAYFQVPLYLSVISLLAIPFVQIHATKAYVDLPANLALSIVILMAYLFYTQPNPVTRGNVLILFMAAAFAANSKLQLIPIVFVVLCLVVFRLATLRPWIPKDGTRPKAGWKGLLAATCVALALVFATPIKNLAVHGNPFYPMKVEIFGVTLNYKMEYFDTAPPNLAKAPRPLRWVYSIMEIGLRPLDLSHPMRWTVDQGMPPGSRGNRMGGFFSAYVVFNLLLLIYLWFRNRSTETTTALILVIGMSALASVMPASHMLRYYMFWMITLVSLNLHLVTRAAASFNMPMLISARNMGLASALALVVVVASTHALHVRPVFYSFKTLLHDKVDTLIMSQVRDGDKVCLYEGQWTFLYASKFHSPLGYSVKRGRLQDECGSFRFLQQARTL